MGAFFYFCTMFTDEYYMKMALQEAYKAYDKEEIPVGCVVVCNDRIIAKSHNLTEMLNDITAHSEMLAITSAAQFLGGKYLKNCTMYITLEPCVMCCGALNWSQISRVVIGARDEHRGYINKNLSLHRKTEVVTGVLEAECSEIIKRFFKERRD